MRTKPNIDQLYSQHIKPLSAKDRLRLLAVMAQDLAATGAPQAPRERSILEMEGLGAELWQDVDAQAYVNELRGEWEHSR